jgi:hypothetical protein
LDLGVGAVQELQGRGEDVVGGVVGLLCAMTKAIVSWKPPLERVDTFAKPLLLRLVMIKFDLRASD